MALQKDRNRIFVKGLGNFFVMEVEPTTGTNFSDAGYFKSANVNNVFEMQDVMNDLGQTINVLPTKQTFELLTELLQTGTDEFTLLTGASTKIHAARLYGATSSTVFQYYCIPKGKIIPNVPVNYQPGERTLPCKIMALYQDLGYSLPLFYFFEGDAEMTLDKLQLWLSPALGKNTETTKILDISGFERHGTLNSDYATIWQQTTTPAEFLRFDGTDDYGDLGDVSDITTEDFAVEFWLRVPTDNGAEEQIVSKKATTGASDVGWAVNADMTASNNQIKVYISDTTGATLTSATGSITANVWAHFFVSFDRDGNGTIYKNGVASGTPTDISTEASTITNSASLYLARLATAYGQVDLGDVRLHNYGVAGLPSTIATIALNHYNAQKADYGL